MSKDTDKPAQPASTPTPQSTSNLPPSSQEFKTFVTPRDSGGQTFSIDPNDEGQRNDVKNLKAVQNKNNKDKP